MALPIDMMINIFLKLPVKSLLRCERVCKLWRNTINTPYFVERHRQSPDARESQFKIFTFRKKEFITVKIYAVNLDIDSNTFALSQNPISELTEHADTLFHSLGYGLFLVAAARGRLFESMLSPGFLYNPIRQQKLNLPPPAINPHELCMYRSAHGLCFDESSKQYKLVRVSLLLKSGKYATELYTLGSNKWKQIAAVPPYQVNGTATPAYGDLHWAVGQFWRVPERYLVSFEIMKEEFKVTPMPNCIASTIFTWREELALVTQTSNDTDTPRVRICVLRDYDNNNSSKWEEVYAITFPTGLHQQFFEYWDDRVALDIIGHEPLLVKIKIKGKDYPTILHWNTKDGLITPMVDKTNIPWSWSWSPEVCEFTSYKFNLVSLV